MKLLQRGFSLIELMIVIAIIGILAAVAIPSYQTYVKKARVSQLFTNAAALQLEVEDYVLSYGTMPGTHGLIWHCENFTNKVWVHEYAGPDIVDYTAALILVGELDSEGGISWTCGTHPGFPIPIEYLPASCQAPLGPC